MNILFLTCYPPGGGGGEFQTQLQVRELTRRGHDVTVIDIRPRYSGRALERDGQATVVRIITPRAPIVRSIVFHLKIVWHVLRRGRRAHVAQINDIGMAMIASVPLLGLLGIPRAVVIWGSAQPGVIPFRPELRYVLPRLLAHRVERIVSLATSSTEYLVGHGFARDRIVFIPNGLDTERFRPRHEGETGSLPEGWPSDRLVVITAGRLVEEKALEVLLDAWAVVARQHPEARLAIAGDGPLKRALVQRAHDLGIQERVLFLGDRTDLPELLRAADVYVSSSRSEGMSNALLEALASGLPVVATRVGAATDIIHDGVTGIIVPPERAEALADALNSLLGDAARRREIAVRARESAVTEFQIAATVDRHLRLYEELVAS